MKINNLSHLARTLCMSILSLGIGGSLFAQFPDSAVGFPGGEYPPGIDTEIFASDKEAFGHHLADVLSDLFYPAGEAKLTMFRNRTHNNGSASYKFTQEIAGLPVIYGDIVLHTSDQGVIYYFRGPVLRVDPDTNEISPPSQALLETVSSLLGGKALDQILYDSSTYFYKEETDETLPGYVLFIDTRDGVNLDSKQIIVHAQKGTILLQSPLIIQAFDEAFWHGGINDWAFSYMGWVYYASNGTMFWLPGGPWHSYTNYDSDTGAMDIYSYNTQLWYYTSAESFPYYWDYDTERWDLFSGTFN